LCQRKQGLTSFLPAQRPTKRSKCSKCNWDLTPSCVRVQISQEYSNYTYKTCTLVLSLCYFSRFVLKICTCAQLGVGFQLHLLRLVGLGSKKGPLARKKARAPQVPRMRMTPHAVQEESERLDRVALPGRAVALKNELLRSTWRRLQRSEPKAVSSVPADRLRRRLS
jgi:hypothetical protein